MLLVFLFLGRSAHAGLPVTYDADLKVFEKRVHGGDAPVRSVHVDGYARV